MAESEEINNIQKESHKELLLDEAKELKEKAANLAANIKRAFQIINAATGDSKNIKETEEYLSIGKECVQPLIEVKDTATEIFSDVKHVEVKMLNQGINVESIEKHLDKLKNWNDESQGIISIFKLLIDSTERLIEHEGGIRENANVNESSVSFASAASSDPSISEFSLFDSNSSISAATSSPLTKTTNLDKQQN